MSWAKEIVEERFYASTVAEEIALLLREAIDERGTASLVLSGGRTPAAVYRALGRPPYVDEVQWDKVCIFWGDERFVPQSDARSNYRLASETLLVNLSEPKPTVYPVNTSLPTPEEAAKAYSEDIKGCKCVVMEEDMPVFDVVLLGMGSDGHIASLFPPVSKNGTVICKAVHNSPDNLERVTMTLDVFLKARKVLFLVTGEQKAEVVKQVLTEEVDPEKFPARYFSEKEGVRWFLDNRAGRLL
ncbi:MAG: 6-phosphogluconolactonase [Candidatus Dadabacteria bacterium]|nr:MAG: 6-phosphogluconolactonase [Candidatus Dadabacteria bacterium]